MVTNYDPLVCPDPYKWLRTDEDQRHDVVRRFHRRAGAYVGNNEQLHCAMHVIVENQIALGDETAVPRTITRLVSQGLDRHDAIHAVGTILMRHMVRSVREHQVFSPQSYDADLEALTPESWLAGDADDDTRDEATGS
jgi:hypothetical protein